MNTTRPYHSGSNKTMSMVTKEWKDSIVGIMSKFWTWDQPQMDLVADLLVVLLLIGLDFVVSSLCF